MSRAPLTGRSPDRPPGPPVGRPPDRPSGRVLGSLLASRAALWVAFSLVHGWLAVVGVVLLPARAFWDVDLYRYWASLALDAGRWPVLDDAWVYPAGALVPVVAPALTGARSTAGYAVAWCVLVTVLDAIAVAVLLRVGRRATAADGDGPAGGTSDGPAARVPNVPPARVPAAPVVRVPDGPTARTPDVPAGVWWWLAFLAALGPVAMGRLDAVVAPMCVVALAVAARRPALAAVLLTAGASVKVAPGALLLPLVAVARRPLRSVVLPAAAVCAVVVALVAAGGGLARIGGFVTEQGRRGLQVESVAATPWVLAGVVDDRVHIAFDERISTWEVTGPGTAAMLTVLDVALPLAVAGLAVLLVLRTAHPQPAGVDRPRPAQRLPAVGATGVLLWGALAASTLLLVLNKVGSPQLVGWLAAPVVVALTVVRGRVARRRWGLVGGGVLAIAAATQVVFPFGADGVVSGDPSVTAVLALRNAGLVVLLVVALRRLLSRPAA